MALPVMAGAPGRAHAADGPAGGGQCRPAAPALPGKRLQPGRPCSAAPAGLLQQLGRTLESVWRWMAALQQLVNTTWGRSISHQGGRSAGCGDWEDPQADEHDRMRQHPAHLLVLHGMPADMWPPSAEHLPCHSCQMDASGVRIDGLLSHLLLYACPCQTADVDASDIRINRAS